MALFSLVLAPLLLLLACPLLPTAVTSTVTKPSILLMFPVRCSASPPAKENISAAQAAPSPDGATMDRASVWLS